MSVSGANLTAVMQISAGREHSLAVLSDGTVVAWGSNVYGQVGDGTKVNRTRAVLINLSGVVDVEAGAHHSLALRSSGTVAAWGRNYRGEVGDGTTAATRPSPTNVPNLTGVTSIAAGRDHNLVVLSDGTMRSWGYNAGGQLGDGTHSNTAYAGDRGGRHAAVQAEGGRGLLDRVGLVTLRASEEIKPLITRSADGKSAAVVMIFDLVGWGISPTVSPMRLLASSAIGTLLLPLLLLVTPSTVDAAARAPG